MTASTATFDNTVNATVAGVQGLGITGNAVFSNTVGAAVALDYLTVSGTTSLANNVTTNTASASGIQTYTAP